MNSKTPIDPRSPDVPHAAHGHPVDMESLSALFDGQLQGDAARFALRRLGHDERWRQACGQWQLAGDVLRRQATGVAPRGLADRIAAQLAVELAEAQTAPVVVGVPGPRFASAAARRRWFGGAALAASVAVVAMFVARPFSQGAAPGPVGSTSGLEVAAVSTPAAQNPVQRSQAAPVAGVGTRAADTGRAPAPMPGAELGTAALAVAEVPRRLAERRSRGQAQRAAYRAASRPAPVAATAVMASLGTGDALNVAASATPFRAPHADAVARPWPRAVLPASPATGGFTASFGTSTATGSPSFYPFEPRQPLATDAPSAVPVTP